VLLVHFFHPDVSDYYYFQESKIGLAVGKLRAHKTKSISDLSKEIVKQWKAAVEKAKAPHTGIFPLFMFARLLILQNALIASKKPPIATATAPAAQKSDARTAKADGAKGGTGDITRDKCVELIYDGLAFDATARMSFCSSSCRDWLDLSSSLQPLIMCLPKLVGWKQRRGGTWAGLTPAIRTRSVPCL
jgi:hypothetical protein